MCVTKPNKYKTLILSELSKYCEPKYKKILSQSFRLAKSKVNPGKESKEKEKEKEEKKINVTELNIAELENKLAALHDYIVTLKEADLDDEFPDGDFQQSEQDADNLQTGLQKTENLENPSTGKPSPWFPCLQAEWKPCALGSLPNKEYPSLNLPISIPRPNDSSSISSSSLTPNPNLPSLSPASASSSSHQTSGHVGDPRRKRKAQESLRPDIEALRAKITLF